MKKKKKKQMEPLNIGYVALVCKKLLIKYFPLCHV